MPQLVVGLPLSHRSAGFAWLVDVALPINGVACLLQLTFRQAKR
jgi:hypothetical protein